MWGHILREQLATSAEAFLACVLEGRLPDRGRPEAVVPRKAVPLHLVRALEQFDIDDDEILSLDAAGAAQLLASLYAAGEVPRDPGGEDRRSRT